MLFSIAYFVTVCNINYIVNTQRGDFNNEYFRKGIFSYLWSGCYLAALCNRFYNSGNVRGIMTMIRFLDFLFWAVSGAFLLFAGSEFISEMGDAGKYAGLTLIVTSILFFMNAIYQIIKD